MIRELHCSGIDSSLTHACKRTTTKQSISFAGSFNLFGSRTSSDIRSQDLPDSDFLRDLHLYLFTREFNLLSLDSEPDLNLAIMGRMSSPAILGELHAAPSAAAQVQALRFLKNDIVGHDQKKERWIELGIILELRRILETHRQDAKRRQHDFNRITEATSDIKSEEEAARLQVVAIIGSLAHG